MKYTKLENSDLHVSRICLGCMGFGDAKTGQHSWTVDEATIATFGKKKPKRNIIFRRSFRFLSAIQTCAQPVKAVATIGGASSPPSKSTIFTGL